MKSKSLKEVRKNLELTTYSNYRTYFDDLYALAKKEWAKYSYVKFAEDLGLGPSNVAFMIIKGKRKLMFKHVREVSDALSLDPGERKFFASLVRLQNASSVKENTADFDTLVDIAGSRKKKDSSADTLLFLSAWHHALVFESLELFHAGATPAILAKSFRVSISTMEVRESLELLRQMGVVTQQGDRYFKVKKNLSTGDTVPGYGVIHFHLKMLELARECLSHEFTSEERNVSSVTLAVSQKGAEKILETLDEFRRKIFKIANDDSNLQKLVQVNFQAFPIIEVGGDKSGAKEG